MKTIIMASIMASAAALLLSAGSASAASWEPISAYGTPLPTAAVPLQATRGAVRVDNGTGYYGRGTATGGPVGGLPDRN